MNNIILYLWQLPQNIIGFLMTRKPKKCFNYICNDCEEVKVYFTSNVFGSGVSLGNYIILDYNNYAFNCYYKTLNATINHEHGHQKQSKYLGWFYLIIVGLTSALCNLWDRLFHKKWSMLERSDWYYSRFPEKWADNLGGVKR